MKKIISAIKIWKDFIKTMLQKKENPYDYIYYKIKSYENYYLGDKITFKRYSQIVMEKEISLDKNLIEFTYVIGQELGFAVPKHYNEKINGMSIKGKVIDTKGNMLRVHLDIDEKQ